MSQTRSDRPRKKDVQQKQTQAGKKAYSRPQLVRHGSVETLTEQVPGNGPSVPIDD